MMRLKSHSLRSWLVRIVVMVTLLAILLLNIRVLTRENSQSEEEETAMLNNQLLPATPLKANGRRNLKQSQVSADDYKVQSSINDSQAVNGPNVKNTHSDIRVNSPISQPRNCGQPHCKEFLRGSEILAMNKCSMETSKRTVNGKLGQEQESELKENDCHFMNGSSTRLPVALASTSGSGNTWIRGLLERATGICTGFLYCDYAMRREGFIGETVKSGNVLVVKTHTISPKWYGTRGPYMDDPYYGAAVYILRNPYKSMIAEWNRKVTYDMLRLPHNESHTNVVQKKFWRIPEWDEFLRGYMERWQTRLKNWVLDSQEHPVHVVRYEDLQQDVPGEVAKVLTFLKIPFNEEELSIRLKSDFTTFKRKHTSVQFDHYSGGQRDYIRDVLVETIKLSQEANMSDILRIHEYLP